MSMMQPQFMNPKFKNMKLDHTKDHAEAKPAENTGEQAQPQNNLTSSNTEGKYIYIIQRIIWE